MPFCRFCHAMAPICNSYLLNFRGTLCTPEMKLFVNTSMLFWACDTNSPEGYRGKIITVFNPFALRMAKTP